MSSVDDRIVNMQFNNKQFTAGAAESQRALEGLDKTIANVGKGGGLSTMGSAVDTVSTKFSALQIAGVAALGTIVSKATSAGLNVVKSLTLGPILQGFSEYQTNLNSIQTVVSNTGESVEKVNGYMQKLNDYSDQTIYNFSEMARNIGTFTAAGVDLKTATSAIQGIANLAALSGSNSQQASTAMYQLSQAIAAGRVGLMDWNSVVNAGMGGKVFQTALAQTAIGMGQISASAVDLGGKMGKLTINGEAFRASISAGAAGGESWLSSEVLVQTLENLDGRLSVASYKAKGFEDAIASAKVEQQQAKLIAEGYSKAQVKSMTEVADRAYEAATVVKTMPQLFQVVKESIGSIWANSFSILMGNFNQSKALWSSVSEEITGPEGIISRMGNAWTGLLRDFVDEGGRTRVIKGFKNLFGSLSKILGTVKLAFQDIFPPATGSILADLALGWRKLTKMFKVSEETLSSLRTIFGGFFAVLHIGFELLKGVGSLLYNVFKAVLDGSGGATSGILSIVASIAEVIIGFDKWLTAGGKLSDTMGDIGTTIGNFIKPFLDGIGLIIQGFATLVGGGGIGQLTGQIDGAATSISSFSQLVLTLKESLQSLFSGSTVSLDTFNQKVASIKETLQGVLSSGGGLEGIFSSIGSAAGGAAAGGLQIASGIISGLASGIASAAPEIFAAISALATSIIETFKSVMGINSPSTEMIQPGFDTIRGIVQGMMNAMSLVGQAVAAVGGFLRDAFVQLFGDMDALDFAALINSIISGGFLIALTNILNTFGSAGFFSGFADIFDQLGNSLQAFQQNLKAQALLAIGTAVALLVGSLVLLALLDVDQIKQGLGTIAIMMGLLVGAMTGLSHATKGGVTLVFISGAMNEMATAILILSAAIAVLGNLDKETLNQGLVAMALALALLVGATRALSGISGQMVAAGAGMIAMAVAMQALAVAVLMFGNLDPDELGQGMTAMALGLALMVGATRAMAGVGPSIALAGVAMVLFAAAMQAIAVAVLMFGKMDPKVLSQGLEGLALSILLMTASLIALGLMAPAVMVASQAMLIMAAAMVVMAHAVGAFGEMDPEVLSQGLAAIAAALVILLVAAAGAMGVAPGLVALGVAIALIGVGVALAGAGMLAFATALSILAVVGVAAIALMVIAIEAFIALLPSIAVQVAASFVSFIETIAAAAPRVREAMTTIIAELLGAFTDNMEEVGRAFASLLTTGIKVLRTFIPQLIDLGMDIMMAFIRGIMQRIPELAEAALTMIRRFLEAIDRNLGPIIDAGTDIIVTLLEGLGEAAGRITKAAGQAILDILNAIDAAVVLYTTDIRDAGLRIIGHLIDGMTGGLASTITDAVGSAIRAGLNAIDLGDIDLSPGFDVPGVPFLRGSSGSGGMPGITRRKGTIYEQAAAVIAATYGLVNASADNNADPKTIQKAIKAQNAADRQQAEANLAEKLAREAEKKAGKKGAGEGAKRAAEKARREAEKQARQAEKAQTKADKAAEAMLESEAFNEGDLGEKGDILNDRAAEMADRANQMLAKANAEAAKARELMKTNKKLGKEMLEQAKKDAKAAKALADKAKAEAEKAQSFYTQEVQARIAALKAEKEAEEKAAKDQAEYDAADTAGKVKILEDRAKEEQAKADKAKAEAERLIAYAESIAATDPAAAMAALDEAEKQAAIAKKAAEEAEKAAQQAEQLLSQPGSSAGGGGGVISPSKSVLEDSAKAVDRYTQSLMEAEILAGASQPVVQYNQNVYSPVALDSATIYRQSKNLVAAQEVKLGYDPYSPHGGSKR